MSSRLYEDVNLNNDQEYSDYENLEIKWGKIENYEISKKIGRGKYSEVFEGVTVPSEKKVVIKILKPVKRKKIKREVKILQNLSNGPNIVKLIDIVRDLPSKTISLIFEHMEYVEFKSLYPKLTDFDVRYYMFEILKGLDYAHSKGIMHRDMKPHNIIVDPIKRQLRIIDWGLSEFYFPNQENNVRVASRYFKSPELLLEDTNYDYSIDVWSVGCIFAGIIFKKEPFFQGQDIYDQLVKIVKVLGTDDLFRYIEKYNLVLDPHISEILINFAKKPWSKFITSENTHLCSGEALDLLGKMLVYDREERITPLDAMSHDYFKPVIEEMKKTKSK